jgi:hypothetical protein
VSYSAGKFIEATNLQCPMMLVGGAAFVAVVSPFVLSRDPCAVVETAPSANITTEAFIADCVYSECIVSV